MRRNMQIENKYQMRMLSARVHTKHLVRRSFGESFPRVRGKPDANDDDVTNQKLLHQNPHTDTHMHTGELAGNMQ